MTIFASAFDESADAFQFWCGSSAWLECRPVTPEVEGSSPFRTAEQGTDFFVSPLFCYGELPKPSTSVPRGDAAIGGRG